MDHDVYLMTEKLQDTHWWFLGRRAILEAVLKTVVPAKGADILDVGCGTGANIAWLERHGRVAGLDPADEAVSACRSRGFEARKGTLPDPAIAPASVDVVTLFDVLEHVDDDEALLREIAKALRPGGKLVMSVPAWPWLWSGHDVSHHHRRRYVANGLEAELAGAGFRVRYVSYFNLLLSPPILLARLAERFLSRGVSSSKSGLEPVFPPLNYCLAKIFAAESTLVPRFRLPFGISLVAVAEKV